MSTLHSGRYLVAIACHYGRITGDVILWYSLLGTRCEWFCPQVHRFLSGFSVCLVHLRHTDVSPGQIAEEYGGMILKIDITPR